MRSKARYHWQRQEKCSLEITEVSRRRCPMARDTLVTTARKWKWDRDSTLSSEPLPFWGQGDKRHGLLFSKKLFWWSRRNTLGIVAGCTGSESVTICLSQSGLCALQQRGGASQDPACSGWGMYSSSGSSSVLQPAPAYFLYGVLLFHFCFSCWFVCCSFLKKGFIRGSELSRGSQPLLVTICSWIQMCICILNVPES